MNPLKPEVNIVLDVLKAVLLAKPDSVFINSLYAQFIERGGLSKKQLEGLHSKALKTGNIPHGKLATLEAIIKKRPTRYRSVPTMPVPENSKEDLTPQLMIDILERYPQHKRLVFLQSKWQHEKQLTVAEKEEVIKFHRILIK